jgi:hypothetical protein
MEITHYLANITMFFRRSNKISRDVPLSAMLEFAIANVKDNSSDDTKMIQGFDGHDQTNYLDRLILHPSAFSWAIGTSYDSRSNTTTWKVNLRSCSPENFAINKNANKNE